MTYIVRTMRDEIDPLMVLQGASEACTRALACAYCIIFKRNDETGELEQAAGEEEKSANDIAQQALERLQDTEEMFDAQIGEFRIVALRCHYHQRNNGAVIFMFAAASWARRPCDAWYSSWRSLSEKARTCGCRARWAPPPRDGRRARWEYVAPYVSLPR